MWNCLFYSIHALLSPNVASRLNKYLIYKLVSTVLYISYISKVQLNSDVVASLLAMDHLKSTAPYTFNKNILIRNF